jgi:predicted transcriptional regulator
MPSRLDQYDLLKLTTQIVSTYVTHQRLSGSELLTLIHGVYRALAESAEDIPTPPVGIAASVTPEYLICLEDGVIPSLDDNDP